MALSVTQKNHLDQVTHTDLAWRRERDEGKERALAEWRERIAHLAGERDRVIRAAVDSGVPHSELRRKEYGRHTTEPNELYASLKRTEHLSEVIAEVEDAGRPDWLSAGGA